MLRRLFVPTVAAAVSIAVAVADSPTSPAQGLLRRLRSRIQSRVYSLPPQQSLPDADPLPNQPANTPSTTARPQRVQPVGTPSQLNSPPTRGTNPANNFGSSILGQASGRPAVKAGDEATSNYSTGNTSTGAGQSPRRPTIGIKVYEAQQGGAGLIVASIHATSAADDAGLRVDDRIITVNGRPARTAADIAEQLKGLQAGDKIRFGILRGAKTYSVSIPLIDPAGNRAQSKTANTSESAENAEVIAAAKPELDTPVTPLDGPLDNSPAGDTIGPAFAGGNAEQAAKTLGIAVEDSEQLRGVVVSSIRENSPASAAGIRKGDRIVSLDGRLLANRDVLQQELQKRASGDQLAFQVVRDGALIAADVELTDPGMPAKPSSTKSATTETAKSGGGTMLEGFGSVLGGLLGGKPKGKADQSDEKKSPVEKDEMALGDEEPIDQVDFESDKQQPDREKVEVRKPGTDPPSLRALELPLGQAQPIQPDETAASSSNEETIQRLRDQIRRLEERLKALESRK